MLYSSMDSMHSNVVISMMSFDLMATAREPNWMEDRGHQDYWYVDFYSNQAVAHSTGLDCLSEFDTFVLV